MKKKINGIIPECGLYYKALQTLSVYPAYSASPLGRLPLLDGCKSYLSNTKEGNLMTTLEFLLKSLELTKVQYQTGPRQIAASTFQYRKALSLLLHRYGLVRPGVRSRKICLSFHRGVTACSFY